MRKTRGFLLIELLVAISIIGLSIVLFAAALNTFTLTQASAHGYTALHIAENKLESVRASGYTRAGSGSFSDPLLSSLPGNATGTVAVSTFNAQTKRVDVSVAWQESGYSTSTISLSTLITQTGGL